MLFMVNLVLVILLLSGSLMRVSGTRIEDRTEYQNCINYPSTCTVLCAASPSLPPSRRVRGQRCGNSVTRSVAERRVETGIPL
jgi:hypothetical protein